jgi:hypothetical protein
VELNGKKDIKIVVYQVKRQVPQLLNPFDPICHSRESGNPVILLIPLRHCLKINTKANAMKKNSKKSLAQTNRPLARKWHPTMNAPLTPWHVTPSSHKKVWWVCGKGHEHRERVIDRYRRGGCPVCTLRARAPRLFETASDKNGRELIGKIADLELVIDTRKLPLSGYCRVSRNCAIPGVEKVRNALLGHMSRTTISCVFS